MDKIDEYTRREITPEQPDIDQCEHGFVVHDIKAQNHFLCRECGERFHRHPDMIEQELFRPDDAEVYDKIAQFRDGLFTFTEVIKQTKLELEEFKEAMQKGFPPEEVYNDVYSLGSIGPVGQELSYVEPPRTSCPAAIEKFFGNPEATVDNINYAVRNGMFPDIEEVRHVDSPETKQMIVEVEFVDGSVQKVVIDHQLVAIHGRKMLRKIGGRHHTMSADGRSNSLIKTYSQYEKDADQIVHHTNFDYTPPKDIRSPWQ